MRYIVNSPGRIPKRIMAKARRRKTGGRRSAAQRRATAKMIAANRARRRTGKAKARRRTTNAHLTRGVNMARRKARKRKANVPKRRRRRNIVANAGRRRAGRRRRNFNAPRRRSRRRNPPAILNQLIQGIQGAGAVVAGEMAANLIANQIPMFLKETQPGAAGGAPVEVETKAGTLARKAIAAVLVGIAGRMVLGASRADLVRLLVAGALTAPVKSVIRPMLPATGPFAGALSAGGRLVRFSSYPRFSAYPRLTAGLAAYPDRTALAGDNGSSGFYGYN